MLNRDEIIFCADNIGDSFMGGAEYSSRALLSYCPFKFQKIAAIDVEPYLIDQHKNKLWVIGNYSRIKADNFAYFIKKDIRYVIIEYDFKFCIYRSQILHNIAENAECDCAKYWGQRIINFMRNACFVAFMSEEQRKIYERNFVAMKEVSSMILGSIFDRETLANLKALRESDVSRENYFLIPYAPAFIKGTVDAVKYAEENNILHKRLGRVHYEKFLNELRQAKGIIYKPLGEDTCPRITIETKLTGGAIDGNENILHFSESWFNMLPDEIEKYLRKQPIDFWKKIIRIVNENRESESIVNA